MTAPLAPAVIGPVYAVANAQVQVDNVLPDALVKVLQNGSEVGHATSTSAGVIWVPTTVALVVGHEITATQTYTGSASWVNATPGVESPPSPHAVTVAAVPKSLPTPVFQSLVNQCSSAVWLANLIPGATVTIDQGGPALAGGLAEFPVQWFNFTGPEPTPGQPLQATQAFGADKSPIGYSADVIPEVTSLPAPVLATPLRDCQTFLDLSDMVPGANVVVTNGGYTDTTTSPAASYTGDLQPLAVGPLTAQQYFSRCERVPHSPVANYTVANVPLPPPTVGYALCPSTSQLTVGNLLPGEILTVSAVVPGSPPTVTELGSQGISSTSATVYLPSLPAGTAAVRLSVGLCGAESEPPPGYITVPVSTAVLPIGPPALQTPLYDCATEVVVTNAHPGCLLTVFSGVVTHTLANPVVAAADVVVIGLMAPLVTGESVQVAQTGCHANGQSKAETVIAIPPIPVPLIQKPVLSDAKSITVSNILPGAQVVLYINGIAAVQETALEATWSIPVPAGALSNARFIEVTQELCGQASTRSDAGPGWAQVQAPAPLPGGGLVGNSGYFFQNSCGDLDGVTIAIDVTQEIGGSGSSYEGFGFQLNCWSAGVTDVNAWQQFAIIIDFNGVSSPSIEAFANTWPFNWDGKASDDTINAPQTLAPLSTPNLPAGYHFTIELTNESPGNQVTSAIFGGSDNLGNPFTPVTITLVGQSDQQGGTITNAQLAPIVAFQLLLVGPINGKATNLTGGAGTMTISASGSFIATNVLPTGGCWSFTGGGTAENSNATYSELPAAPSTSFVQHFSA